MRNLPHSFRTFQSPPSVSFHIQKENTMIIHPRSAQIQLRSKTDINWSLCRFWGTLVLETKNNKQGCDTFIIQNHFFCQGLSEGKGTHMRNKEGETEASLNGKDKPPILSNRSKFDGTTKMGFLATSHWTKGATQVIWNISYITCHVLTCAWVQQSLFSGSAMVRLLLNRCRGSSCDKWSTTQR